MRTFFSSQQIENCIVVVINSLVERAKEGASDVFGANRTKMKTFWVIKYLNIYSTNK